MSLESPRAGPLPPRPESCHPSVTSTWGKTACSGTWRLATGFAFLLADAAVDDPPPPPPAASQPCPRVLWGASGPRGLLLSSWVRCAGLCGRRPSLPPQAGRPEDMWPSGEQVPVCRGVAPLISLMPSARNVGSACPCLGSFQEKPEMPDFCEISVGVAR